MGEGGKGKVKNEHIDILIDMVERRIARSMYEFEEKEMQEIWEELQEMKRQNEKSSKNICS